MSYEQVPEVIEDIYLLRETLDAKAPLASPAFTGTPTVTEVPSLDATLRIATTKYVSDRIAFLVASSPTTLDTLFEIAAALNNDPNFAQTIIASLGTKASKSANLSDLSSIAQALINLGLNNVNNTADADKPVSTAQGASIATRLSKAANLSDVNDVAQALISLGLQRQIYTVVANLAVADVTQTVLFSAHPWARQIEIHALGGAAGGGGGGTGGTGVAVNGGNSGSGAAYTVARYWIDDLVAAGGDRLLITAGKGSTGENGKAGNNQSGSTQGGGPGNASKVDLRSATTLIETIAWASFGRNDGAQMLGSWAGGGRANGTNGQAAGQNVTNDLALNQAGAPGTPGSGISAADVAAAGQIGYPGMYLFRRNAANTPVGTSPGASDVLGWRAGNSGYGGASSTTGNGGRGGNGGPACGGGGGGAARNGFTSGGGGDGGPGIVRVIFFF